MVHPFKQHTRIVSQEFLEHILSLFGNQTANIKFRLDQKVLLTLLDFIGIPVDELCTMGWADNANKTQHLTKANIRILRNIHARMLWEENK